MANNPKKKAPSLGWILSPNSWIRLDPLFLCIVYSVLFSGLFSAAFWEDINIRFSVMLFSNNFHFLHFRLSADFYVCLSSLLYALDKCKYQLNVYMYIFIYVYVYVYIVWMLHLHCIAYIHGISPLINLFPDFGRINSGTFRKSGRKLITYATLRVPSFDLSSRCHCLNCRFLLTFEILKMPTPSSYL